MSETGNSEGENRYKKVKVIRTVIRIARNGMEMNPPEKQKKR